jgi:hypothetical protein
VAVLLPHDLATPGHIDAAQRRTALRYYRGRVDRWRRGIGREGSGPDEAGGELACGHGCAPAGSAHRCGAR